MSLRKPTAKWSRLVADSPIEMALAPTGAMLRCTICGAASSDDASQTLSEAFDRVVRFVGEHGTHAQKPTLRLILGANTPGGNC